MKRELNPFKKERERRDIDLIYEHIVHLEKIATINSNSIPKQQSIPSIDISPVLFKMKENVKINAKQTDYITVTINGNEEKPIKRSTYFGEMIRSICALITCILIMILVLSGLLGAWKLD